MNMKWNIMSSFYCSLTSNHKEKYPQLESRLLELISSPSIRVEPLLDSPVIMKVSEEEYILRFHLCFLFKKDIKRALLYFLLAEVSIHRERSSQFLLCYEEISKIDGSSSLSFYEQLCTERIADWRIYQLLAQLMTIHNNIEDSIQPLSNAIEVNQQCAYAYIDLAFIYAFLMNSQLALIHLKKFNSLNIHSEKLCEAEVAILLLCEQYEQSWKKISQCPHLHNRIEISSFDIKTKGEVDQVVQAIKRHKQTSHSFHECYSILKYLLESKHQPINYCFITLNNKSILNQNIFRADLYHKIKDYSSCLALYKEIIKFITDESNHKNISQQLFGVRFNEKHSQILRQQISYRIYYVMAIALRYLQAQQLIFYCQKAFQITENYALIQHNQNHLLNSFLAELYQRKGNHQQTLAYCKKATKQQEFHNLNCMIVLALVYFRLEQYSVSLQFSQKIIRQGNQDIGIKYIYCMSLFKCNKINYAIAKVKQYMTANPNQKRLLKGLGEIYIGIGELKKAKSSFQKADLLNRSDSCSQQQRLDFQQNIRHSIGIIFLRLGLAQKAIQHFSFTVDVNYQSVLLLGRIYHEFERFQDCILLYKSKLPSSKYHRYYPLIISKLGRVYTLLERYDEASLCFCQQNFYQRIGLSYIGQAFIQYQKKNFQLASYLCIKAIQMNQDSMEPLHILAYIYNKQKSYVIKDQIIYNLKLLGQKSSCEKSFLIGLNIFFKKINRVDISLHYFQKYFDQFNNYYQIHGFLQLEQQKQVALAIEYFLISPSSFWLEKLLLYKLTNSRKCQQQLKVFYRSPEPINQFLFIQIQQSFSKGKKILEYLISEMLQFDPCKGINAIKIAIQKSFLQAQICYKCMRVAFNKAIERIQRTILFLLQVLKKDGNLSDQYYLDSQIQQKTQIKANIQQMLRLKQQIDRFDNISDYQSQQLNHFIAQMMKSPHLIKKINISQTPLVASGLFLKIKYEDGQINERQGQIKKQYRIQKNVKDICFKIRDLIALSLSQQYMKNQLLKFIYKSTYLLYQQINKLDQINENEAKSKRMNEFLVTFKNNKLYTFQKLSQQIRKFSLFNVIFNHQTEIQQSSNISFLSTQELYSSHQYQSSYVSYEHSEINLEGKSQSKVQISQHLQIKKSNSQKFYGVYKFENLKFVMKQSKQPIYYDQQILKNITNLSDTQKSNRLAYLMFKNCFDIMFQIRNNQSKHVANYIFYNYWNRQIIQDKCFQYVMEKSQPIQHKYQSLYNSSLMNHCIEKSNIILNRNVEEEDIKIIDYLWREGPTQIIKFTLQLIKGIQQLQELSIIHLDLQLRNVIKVRNTYKIMDFDNAFKYGPVSCQSFKNLQNIIRHILLFDSSQQQQCLDYLISYVFREIEQKQKKGLLDICRNSPKEEAAITITQELKKYSKRYHLRQLKRMMEFLILEDILGKPLYKQVKLRIELYCNGRLMFQSLVKRLQSILTK